MTGIASQSAPSGEVGLVDAVHHRNHAACGPFLRVVVGVPFPVSTAFLNMTKAAVLAQGGGKEAHGRHELVDGNAFEYGDVLEHLLRHLGCLPGQNLAT